MASLTGISIGFIGLGDIGRPVLRRLKSQGAAISATSRSPALRYKIARDAVDLCKSPSEINDKQQNGLIVLMVSKESLIKAFLEGSDGLLSNLHEGALVIDLGQTSPEATRQYAALVEAKGGHWLDAPAIGSEDDAQGGRLTVRTGGRAEDFERARPALEAISRDIRHMGELGAGQSAATSPS